jgi:hypothetical protein
MQSKGSNRYTFIKPQTWKIMKILSTIVLSALLFGFARAPQEKAASRRHAVMKIGIPDITQTDPFSNFVKVTFLWLYYDPT